MNPLQLPGESDLPMAWTIGQLTGLGLWLGLAVLTLALLILTRTRWGQAKPLGKCVALSIFAHVLLGGYAYGTKLIFTVPVVAEPEVAPPKLAGSRASPRPRTFQAVSTPSPSRQRAKFQMCRGLPLSIPPRLHGQQLKRRPQRKPWRRVPSVDQIAFLRCHRLPARKSGSLKFPVSNVRPLKSKYLQPIVCCPRSIG